MTIRARACLLATVLTFFIAGLLLSSRYPLTSIPWSQSRGNQKQRECPDASSETE